jgi:4-amino-4-deoxy-L-arabinose transferase-like glycosyltransferase
MAQPDTNALTPTLSLKGEGARDTHTPTLSLKSEGVRMGHWLLITLLLLATALRFYRLDAQSFWNDEGNSARLSERSISLIIEGTASDIHPPLYYLILRGWRELVGDTEFGLRSFSAFVGVGLVAVTIALGRVMWGRKTWGVWLAGLLVTLNPALIYYSQEARMYALLAFLALLATLILWGRVSSFKFQVSSFMLYTLTITAGLYTHYFFPTIILVHGVVMVIVVGRDFFNRQSKIVNRKLLYWLLALLAAGLLYLPWLPVFLRQARGRETTTTPVLQFLHDSTQWLLLGGFVSSSLARWVLVVAIGLLLMAFVLAVSRWPLAVGKEPAASGQLLAAILIPLTLMLVGGLTKEPFYKFMLMAIPPLALLLGWAVQVLWRGKVTRGVGVFAAAILILSMLYATREMALNPAYARADYRAIAQRIAADNHSNAGIILNAANQWEVFTYYHRDGAPTYPIPRGGHDQAHIAGELDAIAAQHDRLYAIFWGEAEQDPNRFVERWLDANTFKAVDEWVGDVRLVVYAIPSTPATTMSTPLDLPFGDSITLLGYTVGKTDLSPGDIVELALFWQTDTPLDNRYKIFLHLVDSNGQLVNQRDSEPGGGLALTTTWTPGETVLDNHGVLIPANAPPGEYTVLLGLYDLTDPNSRLPIQTAGEMRDSFPLTVIQVR